LSDEPIKAISNRFFESGWHAVIVAVAGVTEQGQCGASDVAVWADVITFGLAMVVA
jgi:hypothetical protein